MTTAPTPHFGLPGVDAVRRNWGWLVFLGVALILLGMIALGFSFIATVVTVKVIGWLLIFAGVVHVAHAFGTQTWGAMLWHVLEGLLDIVVGILLLVAPLTGAMTITLVLGIMLMVGGVLEIVAGATSRLPNKGWVVFSGVMAIILGVMVLAKWPYSAMWFIGTVVGISLIFRGWMWLMLGLMVKSAPRPA
jgi:uncharacterized membrane protein HdeD (DUF308 family)